MHIFSPQNGALKTHLSHQKMRQNSRAAIWVLKNFPGVNPGPPIRGGEEEGKGKGKGKGRRDLHLLSLIIYMPCMLLASGLNFLFSDLLVVCLMVFF
jgi:hypothetical protein